MKTIHKIFLSIAIISALIVSLCSYAIIRFWIDEAPSKDDDLKITRLEIPEKENAFYYFNQVSMNIYWPEDKYEKEYIIDILKGESWHPKFIDELLEKNEEAFKYFEQGLECSNLQVPEITSFTADAPYLHPFWRNIAHLNSIRSMSLFKSGREKEAFDETLKIIRFGHMVEGSKGDMIHYLVGYSAKKIGLRRIREMLPYTTLESEALLPYIKRLAQYEAHEKGLKDVIKLEYLMDLNTIDILKKSAKYTAERYLELTGTKAKPLIRKFGLKYFLQANRTKRMFAELHRKALRNTSKNYIDMEDFKAPYYFEHFSVIRELVSGNYVGKLIYKMLTPAWDEILLRKCRKNVYVSMTRLLIALKCYKDETGKLPQSLEELVPKYIEKIPEDDFDGRPMRYSARKKMIYSVGEDLEDSGGSGDKKWWELEDPTVKINF